MFRRSRAKSIKENAVSVSELARQLAGDKRFRKRLRSAFDHGSEAGRRTRGSLGLKGTITRLASDERLLAELKGARDDLQRTYARIEAKRRSHKLRNFTLLAALASIAGLPQLRNRLAAAIGMGRQRLSRAPDLEDLTKEELYARAQDADVPGRSEMSKDELISALRARS